MTPPTAPEVIQKRLLKTMITIIPRDALTIPPYKSGEFVINFYARERMKPFTERVS